MYANNNKQIQNEMTFIYEFIVIHHLYIFSLFWLRSCNLVKRCKNDKEVTYARIHCRTNVHERWNTHCRTHTHTRTNDRVQRDEKESITKAVMDGSVFGELKWAEPKEKKGEWNEKWIIISKKNYYSRAQAGLSVATHHSNWQKQTMDRASSATMCWWESEWASDRAKNKTCRNFWLLLKRVTQTRTHIHLRRQSASHQRTKPSHRKL